AIATIDPPGSILCEAHGINDAGKIVGSFVDTRHKRHGFVRSAGAVFSTIDIPGASSIDAFGINDAGRIVGTFKDAKGYSRGFTSLVTSRP
ncbi:MAG TPA: hypothetical protein VGQ96_04670, partial [Candidatus Eremiobacteraceae bacterium]|nr:hypothetical protein [Candidatus Eremiobacteraceae bacterium]